MEKQYDQLANEAEIAVREAAKSIIAARGDEDALDGAVYDALCHLTAQFGTEDYGFNLSVELLVEKLSPLIEGSVCRILDRKLPEVLTMFDIVEDLDVLFFAYYTLSLVYKKTENIDGLRSLLAPRYQALAAFPLKYEVHARCCKRTGELRQALQMDQYAINLLASRQVQNYAVCISYASTVCSMLKGNYEVAPSEIQTAEKYIEKALAYNPKYPKYYFVKAQLLYHTHRHLDLEEFQAICNQAISLVEKDAQVALFNFHKGQSAHYEKEMKKYFSFVEEVRGELLERRRVASPLKFAELTVEEVASMKQQILHANRHSESLLPPMPRLSPGEKYVYICYSSLDYQSVYCDLVEFYAQKIPFKYDERLTPGHGWTEQVAEYITNPNCVGVVFYISKNTLISHSFCEEIQMVCHELKKDYFAVNLEGDTLPSRILADTVLTVYRPEMDELPFTAERIISFLSAFDDTQVFTAKLPVYGKDGTRHLANFKNAIYKRFSLTL